MLDAPTVCGSFAFAAHAGSAKADVSAATAAAIRSLFMIGDRGQVVALLVHQVTQSRLEARIEGQHAREVDGTIERVDDAARDVGRVRSVGVPEQHDELVLADACERVLATACDGRNAHRHLGHQPVACRVAEGVADLVEVPDVNRKDRECALPFAGECDGLGDAVAHRGAIGQARQRILERHPLDRPFRFELPTARAQVRNAVTDVAGQLRKQPAFAFIERVGVRGDQCHAADDGVRDP